MIRIEVVSSTFDERSGSKNGKNWVIREQAGYAHLLDEHGKPMKYPVACSIPLDRDAPAYQPGFYTLDPRSIYVGDFRRLAPFLDDERPSLAALSSDTQIYGLRRQPFLRARVG